MTAAKVVGVDGPTQVPLHVSERTQRKFECSSALDCVQCEKTWLRMAQVTPSTEFALRKWVESLTWVVTQSGVCSSFVQIENEVHDEERSAGRHNNRDV